MINLRTRKIIRDIWFNKARSALVILTIGISIFALGAMGRIWYIMSQNVRDTYLAVNPASATLITAGRFDEDVVPLVERLESVEQAEPANTVGGRIQIGDNRWRSLTLFSSADLDSMAIGRLQPEEGTWPPPDGTIVLERSSLAILPFEIGDTVTLEFSGQSVQEVTVVGSVHDVTRISSGFTLIAYGYVNQATYNDLLNTSDFNRLNITVAENEFDQSHIEDVAADVRDVLELERIFVARQDIPEPGVHPINNIIQSVLLLLSIMTVLGSILGTFLITNIVSAQLTQQTQQIGIFKSVGGVSRQVIIMYLRSVLLFGLIALIIILPLVTVFSRSSTTLFASLINFEIVDFRITVWNIIAELIAAFLLPTLAALYPILKASRLTVRESIGFNSGQDAAFGESPLDGLLNKIPSLPSTIVYPFRNIFRRKVRMMLAAITLSVAGAVWLAVAGVRASVNETVDQISLYWQEDLNIGFRQVSHAGRIGLSALELEGVDTVEYRLNQYMFRVRPDGTQAIEGVDVFGIAPDTPFIEPQLIAGRWLRADDTNAAVINIDFLDNEPDIQIGDELMLTVRGQDTRWEVVGIATSQVAGGSRALNAPIVYVSYDHLSQVLRLPERADRIVIGTDGDVDQIAQELEVYFAERGTEVANIVSRTDVRQALDNSFSLVLTVLQIASLLFGVVGALGLTSMMTLNVLERTREIGIIRSVGGVRRQLAQIVVTEAVFVGLMSWVLAVILGYPLSIAIGTAVGNTLLGTPLITVYPLGQPFVWLAIVIVLSIAASLIPGRSAARLSVREAISFE
jgi:putative ABC transport system permease protein